jgi:hypothetical protein
MIVMNDALNEFKPIIDNIENIVKIYGGLQNDENLSLVILDDTLVFVKELKNKLSDLENKLIGALAN